MQSKSCTTLHDGVKASHQPSNRREAAPEAAGRSTHLCATVQVGTYICRLYSYKYTSPYRCLVHACTEYALYSPMLSDHLLRASTNLVHSTIVRMEYKNGILRTVLVRECNTDGYCTSVLYCTTAVFLRSDHLNDLIDGRGGAPRPFSLNLLPAQSHHRQVDIFPVADKRHRPARTASHRQHVVLSE